jgi:glycine/D-amino acid oxidase-like deaminating enzyme
VPSNSLNRRGLLTGSLAAGGLGFVGLSGCAPLSGSRQVAGLAPYDVVPPLAPLRPHVDRIFDITVCTRPFRAAGPRLDTETIGSTLVVHNYGHGGSGWSLSWGSAMIAVQKAMAGSPREVAVLGSGALGLTSATLAQRAGAKVTIYARDLLPQARSSRATGSWTPDSRIALTETAGPDFAQLWEQMARTSFKYYRSYLGLPGEPVEFLDRYTLTDFARGDPAAPAPPDPLGFGKYEHLIDDLTPHSQLLPAGSTPFDAPFVYRNSQLTFNVANYGHTLMTDFLTAGGVIKRREFHTPAELADLPEKVVINCPGYAARALWQDESVMPVRGQIAWLIPQRELNYGVYYHGVYMLPRRDGIVIQAVEGGDMKGYGDDTEIPDRAEAEHAVVTMADLYSRFRPQRPA